MLTQEYSERSLLMRKVPTNSGDSKCKWIQHGLTGWLTPMYWLRLVLRTSSESLKFIKNMHMFSFEPSSYFYHIIRQDTLDFSFFTSFLHRSFRMAKHRSSLGRQWLLHSLGWIRLFFRRSSRQCAMLWPFGCEGIANFMSPCHHGSIVALRGECDRKPCSFRKHRFLFAEVVLFIQFSTDFTQSTDPLVNRSRSPFRGMQSDWNELKQPTINICNLESPLAFGLVAVCKTPLFWACLIIFWGCFMEKNLYLRHMPRAGYILSPTKLNHVSMLCLSCLSDQGAWLKLRWRTLDDVEI